MRPALITAIGLAAILLCVGAGVAWNKVIWRTGWLQGPPPMARGMPPQAGSISTPWSRRLRQAFPIGSSERRMTEQLRREGFQVDVEQRRAAYGWAAYPCVYTLTVSWRADQARRVREVQGGLLNACTDPRKLIPERPSRRGRPEGEGPERKLVPETQSA